jgi:CHAT domain-containing protein
LNQWGERLLGPLRTRLPDRVYLAASGALATAPLELLRTSGTRPLAGRQLVRLASYPARPGPAGRLQLPGVDRVFLAGLPQDFSAGFLERLEAGAELSAVMDVYRGPGLQVVQGSALFPDEFATDALSQAQIVHLAMPAWIDLDAPGRSYLELSEIRRGAGRLRQDPGQLAAWTLSAGLSVISQARLHLGQSAGAVRPPLISDLLSAGSASVLASGWQADDQVSAQFFSDFHGALMQGQSVTDALEYARAQRMASGEESLDWARYQLWLD